jgi:hypothetical protein
MTRFKLQAIYVTNKKFLVFNKTLHFILQGT